MARIVSVGSYLPSKMVKNEFFGKPDNAEQLAVIEKYMTGMSERRHASENETGVYMSVRAAEDAIEHSPYDINDIDLIIGNITPNEHLLPEDLNIVLRDLGAKNASVLPINTACSSFLTALNLSRILLAAGEKKVILIINATNWVNNIIDRERDYSMFGDGAGAAIVDNQDEDGFIALEEDSDPSVFHTMCMKSPVFTGQAEYFMVREDKKIDMVKDQINKPIDTAKLLLGKTDVRPDHFIAHQAGVGMLEYWLSLIDLDKSILRHTFDKHANMMSANIPVSLSYWVRSGKIKRGDTILFFSPAAGAYYISILWKY